LPVLAYSKYMLRSAKELSRKKNTGQQKQNGRVARKAGRNPAARDRHLFIMPPTVSKSELLDEDGTSDRRFRQFLYDFSVLAAHLEFARAYLASQIDLSSPQYNIAMIIAQYQGAAGISVSDVAQHLHVTTAFITSEVGKLEQAGLVEKRQNPNDGRGVLLRLSAGGEAKALQIGPKRLLINDHLFRALSGEDFRQLARIAASLIDDFTETINMLRVMAQGPNAPQGQIGR
jgi:DNA-binding MarR family transcriptional regulator